MPSLKTEITELATALGALGYDLRAGLQSLPPEIVNVSDATWERLRSAYEGGLEHQVFMTAWANGRSFLLARDGLRGRIPIRIEWKGPDRQVEQDPIPADLRVDNVFLVSVKTRSSVLWNRSPSQVFQRTSMSQNWYLETAPEEYQALYESSLAHTGIKHFPVHVADLSHGQALALGAKLPPRSWPPSVGACYRAMARRCARRSAEIWNNSLSTRELRERAAWWLLRLAPAPYFLLGASTRSSLRVRVDTPWDWRQTWSFQDLEVRPALNAGQPQVEWSFSARHLETGEVRHTAGYVEVRWSHGRFSGRPEAKVQLRTAHELVPGYTPLI